MVAKELEVEGIGDLFWIEEFGGGICGRRRRSEPSKGFSFIIQCQLHSTNTISTQSPYPLFCPLSTVLPSSAFNHSPMPMMMAILLVADYSRGYHLNQWLLI